jgi:nicotinamide riboside kinase
LTLLLEPDIPWVADGLQRDGISQRATVHALIERALAELARPVVRISGSKEERLLAAERAVLSVAL